MCCSVLNRADFLEEGRFNSTPGLASLLRCKSGAAAREGQREDEVVPVARVPESLSATGPGLHSGSIMELPVPKERRRACRTDPLHVAIHRGSGGASLAVSVSSAPRPLQLCKPLTEDGENQPLASPGPGMKRQGCLLQGPPTPPPPAAAGPGFLECSRPHSSGTAQARNVFLSFGAQLREPHSGR